MTKQRADLGFGEEPENILDPLEDFDPTAWKPEKPKAANDPAKRAAAEKAAAASGFKSREPAARSIRERGGEGASMTPPRRRRTGRNAQFNLKARPETIEAYCAIADAQGWGLGETLERAVDLLEKQFGRPT